MRQGLRLLGLAAFMASLTLLGWWWIRVASRSAPAGGWRAGITDVVLFSAFALHHSLFARRTPKDAMARLVPSDLVRTVYVCIASVLLVITCVLWQPVGGVAYSATGGAAAVLALAQLLGVIAGVLAVRRISVRELAGLREPDAHERLQIDGPYRLVRHPLYLGWVLVVFGAAHMTGDRLLFAIVSTVYLVLAMPLEEAALARQFGDQYQRYRRAVRWRLIPYIH
jgi:protein-S-isoprenylcysteine O-methyltransferase Ste14